MAAQINYVAGFRRMWTGDISPESEAVLHRLETYVAMTDAWDILRRNAKPNTSPVALVHQILTTRNIAENVRQVFETKNAYLASMQTHLEATRLLKAYFDDVPIGMVDDIETCQSANGTNAQLRALRQSLDWAENYISQVATLVPHAMFGTLPTSQMTENKMACFEVMLCAYMEQTIGRALHEFVAIVTAVVFDVDDVSPDAVRMNCKRHRDRLSTAANRTTKPRLKSKTVRRTNCGTKWTKPVLRQ